MQQNNRLNRVRAGRAAPLPANSCGGCRLHRLVYAPPNPATASHSRPADLPGVQMSGVIQLVTEVPGPKSRALLARRAEAVPRGVPAVTPIAVISAEGAVVTD